MNNIQLAIDVGATGIKGALVDVSTGTLTTDRIKYDTPKPATPIEVITVAHQIVKDLNWVEKPIGIGFPAIIKNDVCLTASNIDKSWIDIDIKKLVKEVTGLDSHTLNDADAAGLAEMEFGKGKGVKGTVIMLTLGTGIGSGIFKDGALLSNSELGRMIYKDSIAEHYASNSARKRENLEWDEYGKELNTFLEYVDRIFSPDLILIGGGISKKFAKYSNFLNKDLKVIPAALLNNAGIIGAAVHCHKQV